MFADIKTQVEQLEADDRYTEAIALLEEALENYPDDGYYITEKLGEFYTHTEQYQKAIDIWTYGAEHAFFYCHNPGWPIYQPYAEFEKFHILVEKDRLLREAAIKASKTRFEVATPRNYTADRQYPLLLVFHGGNSHIDRARPYWVSKRLQEEFLVAFIQSYLYYGMESFGWKRSDQRAWAEIKSTFGEIIERYSVDQADVFAAGISAGGMVAIEIALADIIDLKGFIGVCPVMPGEAIFNIENIANAKESGQCGVIISGEQDSYTGPQAQKMVEAFDEAGYPHQFVLVPEMGHEYPVDFTSRLDEALAYLRK